MVSGEAILGAENSAKTLVGRGAALYPAEGAHSAPPDPLAGGEGVAAPPQERQPRSRPSDPNEKLWAHHWSTRHKNTDNQVAVPAGSSSVYSTKKLVPGFLGGCCSDDRKWTDAALPSTVTEFITGLSGAATTAHASSIYLAFQF